MIHIHILCKKIKLIPIMISLLKKIVQSQMTMKCWQVQICTWNEARGVIVSVNFHCFSLSRFSHFHCISMRKAIMVHKNLHTNQQNKHTPDQVETNTI